MSAELLRRAAARMRAAAVWSEKQYTSPWSDEDNEVLDARGDTVAEVVDLLGVNYLTEHIASWHPAVALAVADLLDSEAKLVEDQNAAADRVFREDAGDFYCEPRTRFTVLARAYLGEDTP